ncbi:MAG: carboxypeptidase-like regulatory domain-containing protein [Bacteroidota bacterium]
MKNFGSLAVAQMARLAGNHATLLVLLALFLTPAFALAQAELQATVTDSSGQLLAGANVIALQASDSLLKGFAVSDGQGRVRIRNLAAGSYLLRTTFLGYQRADELIEIAEEDQLLDLGQLTMQEESYYLNTASISGRRIPIRMRGDTMVYDAQVFSVREGAAVEELLRRLPGLSVDATGAIEYQGRPVNEVMIDGQPFFANNPTLLTRELPAVAVDEVAVYDQESDTEAISGQSDGVENLTIDLALTDDFVAEWFGRLNLGAGTDERYRANANLFRIGRNNRLGTVLRSNNLNEIDDPLAAFNPMAQFLPGNPGLERASGQNRSTALGWQYGMAVGKHGQLSFTGSLAGRSQRLITDQNEFYIDNLVTDRIELLDTAAVNPRWANLQFEYRYKRDSLLRWRLDLSINPRREEDNRDRRTSIYDLDENLITFARNDSDLNRTQNLNANWEYSRRLAKPGQTLSMTSEWSYELDRTNWSAQFTDRLGCPESTCGSPNETNSLGEFFNRRRDWTQNSSVGLSMPLSGPWSWNGSLGFEAGSGRVDNEQKLPENDILEQNAIDQDYWELQPSFSLERNRGGNVLSLGIGYNTLSFEQAGQQQRRTYLAPRIGMRVRKNRWQAASNLRVNASRPQLEYLLPINRPDGNGQIQLANSELDAELRHQLFQSVSYSDIFREIFITLSGGASYVDDAFASQLQSTANGLTSIIVNADYAWDRNWRFSFNFRPPILFDRIEMTHSHFQRSAQLLQEGQLRSSSNQYELKTVNNFGDAGFLEMGASWQRQRNGSEQQREDLLFKRFSLHARFERSLGERWQVGFTVQADRFAGANLEPSWIPQSEANISWKPFNNREHLIELRAGDLWNQNQTLQRQQTPFALIEQRNNNIGRFLMAGVQIKF